VSKIAVVTDSISCMPPDIQNKYNILIAPCYLIWDKVQYRDGVDMTAREAYERLRTAKTLPTTTSAIQGEYIKIYESLKGDVDGIVVTTVTGGLGACYNSAIMARDLVPGIPVEVIDSRTAHLALAFVTIEAAKVALSGGSLQEVVQKAQDMVSKVRNFYYMDSMEYIKRCGRVSLPQEILDKWTKTRVMMLFKDGKLDPQQIQGKPQDQLLSIIDQTANNKSPLHVGIYHGDVDPNDLKNKILSRYHPVEIFTNYVTPVAGVHVGPGTMGISLYNE
jgi:DegV family protein with EDD domain